MQRKTISLIVLTFSFILAGFVPGFAMSDDEKAAVEFLNEDRRRAGLEELLPEENLADLARSHAVDMLEHDYFSHIDRKGRNPFERMRDAGIAYSAAGENLYKGLNDPVGEDLLIAQRFLMQSPSHRKNILDRDFSHIGVGLVRSEDGWLYLVQCFIRPPDKGKKGAFENEGFI